jgi:Family of unknown function (DUF6492)
MMESGQREKEEKQEQQEQQEQQKPQESWDIVTCIGPTDEPLLATFLSSLVRYLAPRRIYVITLHHIIEQHRRIYHPDLIHWIDEAQFPFRRKEIHDWFHTPNRSGWYLQQLLKLYAPLLLSDLSEHFIYVDADVRIHRPLRFFDGERILFNVGDEFHPPYFCHMERLLGLYKVSHRSGICHLMPMKRQMVKRFHADVERRHGISCWKAFLAMVDPAEYGASGASEYELLFSYTLLFHPDEAVIRPLLWQDTSSAVPNTSFDYEAYHGYMRTE